MAEPFRLVKLFTLVLGLLTLGGGFVIAEGLIGVFQKLPFPGGYLVGAQLILLAI